MSGIGAGPMMLVESAPGLSEPANVVLSDSGGFVRVDWDNTVVDPNVITRISSADGCSLFLVRLSEPTISGIEFFISSETLLNGRCWRIRHENTVTGQVSSNVELVETLEATVCDPPTNLVIANISFCNGPPIGGIPNYIARAIWTLPPGNTDPVFPEIEWFSFGNSLGVNLLTQNQTVDDLDLTPLFDITILNYRLRLRCGTPGSFSTYEISANLEIDTNPCTGEQLEA